MDSAVVLLRVALRHAAYRYGYTTPLAALRARATPKWRGWVR